MFKPSHRSALKAGRLALVGLFFLSIAYLPLAHAGLDEGAFDMCQSPLGPPEAWAWSPDSTSDGDGVKFVAYLGTFQHAGMANPSLTTTVTYKPGAGHQNLQQFISWIIANNEHVTSSGQLTLVKHVVTTVTLP